MADILVVGGATLDIVNEVSEYPDEDSEVRALAQRVVRGGNAANTAVMLAKLGHQVRYLGTLADDDSAKWLREDLEYNGVDTRLCPVVPHSATPTSYVLASRKTGSRSIVHHRQLAELSCRDFPASALPGIDWVHFEGRNLEATACMLRKLHEASPDVPCSLEVEKPREGIEKLFTEADVLLFSKVYARAQGFASAQTFLPGMAHLTGSRTRVCAWGKEGASLWHRGDVFSHKSRLLPDPVDSLGAGDVLNAAIIDGSLKKLSAKDLLVTAVELASKKCQTRGFEF